MYKCNKIELNVRLQLYTLTNYICTQIVVSDKIW